MSRPPGFVGVSLKMYLDLRQTSKWCERIAELASGSDALGEGSVELVVLPTFTAIERARSILAGSPVGLGAQNLFWTDDGPYTGEVSGRTLSEIGARYVEVGHAERRRLFGETDEIVRLKIDAAIRNGLTPIVCVGEEEPVAAPDAGAFCIDQLKATLADVLAGSAAGKQTQPQRIVIAYEPVWAIGREEPAPTNHIVEVCAQVRAWLEGQGMLSGSQLIYGGSAGVGLLAATSNVLDGLFLGRYGHDPLAVSTIVAEAAVLVSTTAGTP